MPRANRYWVQGAAYHLTHRCHDRKFLLERAIDRDAYRTLLRKTLPDSQVSLLSYTITSNHVHLLVTSETARAIARLMKRVQGQFAEAYNRRKNRQGAYWSDRYHCTMIDNGFHLLACLRYIDLNMVRAGVVTHPRQWNWTAWHELVGERKRYRLVDRDALMGRLHGTTWSDFTQRYRESVEEALARDGATERERRWTESLAVGSADFTQRIDAQLSLDEKRSRTYLEEDREGEWVLRETNETRPLEPNSGGTFSY